MARTYPVLGKVVEVKQPTADELAAVSNEGGRAADLRFATVSLQTGDSFNIDLGERRASVWLDLLNELRQEGAHVFLEVDPDSNTIQKVLLPKSVMVESITPTVSGDRLNVELRISHARHFVSTSHPDFQRIRDALQEALKRGERVLVTETPNEHEIIDVRVDPGPKRGGVNLSAASAADLVTPHAFSEISESDALKLFEHLAGQPQIPFNYPDDGCWGRAHEMRRLMIERGYQPGKIWIYGNLRVSTPNHPQCRVYWGWHVAPTLKVRSGGGSISLQVVDPSLFGKPVVTSEWAGVQGDSGALLRESDSRVFYRTATGEILYDDDYLETKAVLRDYSRERDLRFAEYGKPPYNCP